MGLSGQLDKGIQIDGGTDNTAIGNVGDQAKVADICNTAGSYKTLTVGTTAVLAIVGGSVLANRKYLSVQPKANGVFYGFDNSVTTSSGTELFKDQLIFLPVGAAVTVYLIAGTAGNDVRIGELS